MSVSRSDATAPAAPAAPSPVLPPHGPPPRPRPLAQVLGVSVLAARPARHDRPGHRRCGRDRRLRACRHDRGPFVQPSPGVLAGLRVESARLGRCLQREPRYGRRADRPGPPRRGLSACAASHHPHPLTLPVPTRRPSQAAGGRIANAGASPRSGAHPHHGDRHHGNPYHRRTPGRL